MQNWTRNGHCGLYVYHGYDEQTLITVLLANRNLNISWTPSSIITVVPHLYFYYFCSLSPSFSAFCVKHCIAIQVLYFASFLLANYSS